MHLYRIAQEALANAVRHSEASQIDILVAMEGSQLKLKIEDNGKGINTRAGTRSGMGLRTMQYRAQALGALLTVGSRVGGGTVVTCAVNISKESP